MYKISVTLTILCLSLHVAHQYKISSDVETTESDNHFDLIVLSQEWPITVCIFYKYVLNPGGNCILQSNKKQWTLHGIWPRKIEGKYPEYCNKSWNFDPETIRSIEDSLFVAQLPVYKEDKPYRFWAHEWSRHGTCAALFEPLNTQFKYFSKGIEWNKKYSLSDMLEAANIHPSDTTYLDPEEVANAVKAKTKKDPMIGCYVIDDVIYLQEVRICLDKKFVVVDCKLPVIDEDCKSSKGFIYPANDFRH